MIRSFDFVGMNSQAVFDSDFWRKDKHVPSTLNKEISRSLSIKIPLETQYKNNSGRRWQEWDKDRDRPQSIFPETNSFDEAVEKYERLVKGIRDKQFRDKYNFLIRK
jgi:hypothetical protein